MAPVRATLRKVPTVSKYDDPDEIYDREIEVEALTMRLADVIQETLEGRGLTRADLARALGVSKAHITQSLSGQRNLTLKTVAEALHALDSRLEVSVAPLTAHPRHGDDVAAHLGGNLSRAESLHMQGAELRNSLDTQAAACRRTLNARWDHRLRSGGQKASGQGLAATQAVFEGSVLAGVHG